MKHWTEPNGKFIVNIPIEWQYINVLIDNEIGKPPYSFEPYEDPLGCFQLSCYPLDEKGINSNFPIQENNSKVKWLMSRMADEKLDVFLFHAQVDDQFCMAKYIYSSKYRNDKRIKEQLIKVKLALDSFKIIPLTDREWAANLDKHDNFLTSLAASYDLLMNAYESESYIELVVILSNQIDAFLRLAIILKDQLENESDDIKIKYLFQGDDERGINERNIYKKAQEVNVVDDETFNELNDLYDLRNKVIHRYIISLLKTRDIVKIAYKYSILQNKIIEISKSFEEMQFGKGFGIYGRGYSKDDVFDDNEYRRISAMANDKHLIEKLKRKI